MGFFSHKLCSTLSVDKENLNRVLFLHAEYTRSFFSISTLYTRRHRLKKGKVSTNTVHYDKSGNGHIFCNAIFNLYNPPLRFGCWVVYKSKTGLFIQSSIVLNFFCRVFFHKSPAAARYIMCNLTITSLQKQKQNLLQ